MRSDLRYEAIMQAYKKATEGAESGPCLGVAPISTIAHMLFRLGHRWCYVYRPDGRHFRVYAAKA